MKQGTQSLCSGTTQRNRVGREVGGDSEVGVNMHTCGQFRLMYGKIITILESNYLQIKINKKEKIFLIKKVNDRVKKSFIHTMNFVSIWGKLKKYIVWERQCTVIGENGFGN